MRLGSKVLSTSLITFCLCSLSHAQEAGQIKSMKLLTANVGWAATDTKLFWTTDGGSHWKDITPRVDHKRQMVSSVFFLNASTGWVLLSCGDDRDPLADDVCFEFALTTDSGENWSTVHPKIVDPVPARVVTEDGQGFSGTTYLDFADAQHGWAILKRNLALGRSAGTMLRTADGGKTWMQLPKDCLPIADDFRFVTAKDGWMAGGPDQELYVTRDAGDTWNKVVVSPPPAIKVQTWPPEENGVWPSYELPFFKNRGHGLLLGSYWNGSKPTSVVFSTSDLGRTWKFERMLPDVNGAITVTDSTLFAASTPQGTGRLTFMRLPLGEERLKGTTLTVDLHRIPITHYLTRGLDALDMIDNAHGWLLADELVATSDGGVSWKVITPPGFRRT